MNISKLFGGNREEARPISSNRHKKIDYFVDGRKELKSAIDTLVKELRDAKRDYS